MSFVRVVEGLGRHSNAMNRAAFCPAQAFPSSRALWVVKALSHMLLVHTYIIYF